MSFVSEPNRLHLIWQASNSEVRKRFVVGELVRSGTSVSLAYHYYSDDLYEALMLGFVGHPAFPLSQPVHHQNVIEIFSRRLPPRNRADYNTYLTRNRLPIDRPLSDFTILGYAGGALPSDGFYCALNLQYEPLPIAMLMEVAGFRYNEGMNFEIPHLLNMPVSFVPEPENPKDSNAVAIYAGPSRLGYVPRYHAGLFKRWSAANMIVASVERIDGTLTKPQVHLMVHIMSNYASARAAKGKLLF